MFSYKAEAPSGSPSEALSPCNGCPPYGVLVFWLLHCLSSPTFSTVQPQVIDVPIKTLEALQARSSVKSAPLKWIVLRQMQRGRTASLSSLTTLRIVAWDSCQKPISKYQLREASTYCARLWTKRTVQWNVQPSWKHITWWIQFCGFVFNLIELLSVTYHFWVFHDETASIYKVKMTLVSLRDAVASFLDGNEPSKANKKVKRTGQTQGLLLYCFNTCSSFIGGLFALVCMQETTQDQEGPQEEPSEAFERRVIPQANPNWIHVNTPKSNSKLWVCSVYFHEVCQKIPSKADLSVSSIWWLTRCSSFMLQTSRVSEASQKKILIVSSKNESSLAALVLFCQFIRKSPDDTSRVKRREFKSLYFGLLLTPTCPTCRALSATMKHKKVESDTKCVPETVVSFRNTWNVLVHLI